MRNRIEEAILKFFKEVEAKRISIYNEFSLQHEIGIFLRSSLGDTWKVEFERPVDSFNLSGTVKREIDLVLYQPGLPYKAVLEFKFPRNGQYPEQMFKACQDIVFLEELVSKGFQLGAFVMAVEDSLFHTGKNQKGIYSFFRGGMPISGEIIKPTGAKDERVSVTGIHHLKWLGKSDLRYLIVFVE